MEVYQWTLLSKTQKQFVFTKVSLAQYLNKYNDYSHFM